MNKKESIKQFNVLSTEELEKVSGGGNNWLNALWNAFWNDFLNLKRFTESSTSQWS